MFLTASSQLTAFSNVPKWMKATEQYFPVVLCIMLRKMVLRFVLCMGDFLNECGHSNENYCVVRSCCGAVY